MKIILILMICISLFFTTLTSGHETAGEQIHPEPPILNGVDCEFNAYPDHISFQARLAYYSVHNSGAVTETVNITISKIVNNNTLTLEQFEITLLPDDIYRGHFIVFPGNNSQNTDKIVYNLECYVVEDEDVYDNDGFETTVIAPVLSIADILATENSNKTVTINAFIKNNQENNRILNYSCVNFLIDGKLINSTNISTGAENEEGTASITVEINDTEFSCTVSVPENGYYGENKTLKNYSKKFDLSQTETNEKTYAIIGSLILISVLFLIRYLKQLYNTHR